MGRNFMYYSLTHQLGLRIGFARICDVANEACPRPNTITRHNMSHSSKAFLEQADGSECADIIVILIVDINFGILGGGLCLIRLRLLMQPPPLLQAAPPNLWQLNHGVEYKDEKRDDVQAEVLDEVQVPGGDLQVVGATSLCHQVDQLDRPFQWVFGDVTMESHQLIQPGHILLVPAKKSSFFESLLPRRVVNTRENCV